MQKTPISTPSTSITLRPGSGNSDALPIAVSPILSPYASPRAAIPHRQIDEAEIDRSQHLAHHNDDFRRRHLLGRNRCRKSILELALCRVELDGERHDAFEVAVRELREVATRERSF